MRDRGFTLVELMVSIGLMGIVAATICSVFVSGLRTYSRQIELSHVRANLRLANATLTRELRGLDAGDSLGSDISEMLPSSLTYRAARSTYFLCTVPDVAGSTLTVWQSPFAGLRQIEPGRDSLLLFAENEVATPLDNVWVPAAVSSVTAGQFCPGGDAGLRLVVDGVSPGALEGLHRGSVVRGFQNTTLLLYSDAAGRSWVGLREWRPGSGWSITQPILGPVTRDGLRFEYFAAGGGPATRPAEIVRISFKIVGVGSQRVAAGVGSHRQVRDSLVVHVGLRNNPRPW